MANIDVDRSGRWLFAASYGGNKITVNAIDKDGLVGAVQQLIATGPNAHAIHADAANRFVFATSLGGDNVSSWRFDPATGTLSANDPALTTAPAKSGPRHFVWNSDHKRVYLLGELDGSLAVYDYDAARRAARGPANDVAARRLRHRSVGPLADRLGAGVARRRRLQGRSGERALAPLQRYAVGKNPNWIEIVDLP